MKLSWLEILFQIGQFKHDGTKTGEHSARTELFRPGESKNGFGLETIKFLERTIILKYTENFSHSYNYF